MAKERGRGETKRDELIRENERLRGTLSAIRSGRRYTFAAALTKEAIKWGALGFFGWLSVRELAGRVTVVDAAVDLCGSMTDALKELVPSWTVQIVTILVALVSILFAKRTRVVNRRLVKRAAAATRKYEELVDPNRSSSGLGDDGDTHDEDKL